MLTRWGSDLFVALDCGNRGFKTLALCSSHAVQAGIHTAVLQLKSCVLNPLCEHLAVAGRDPS